MMKKQLRQFFDEYGVIFQRNLTAPIVLIIAILVILLAALGQRGDAFFLGSVIALNTVISITQEIRAQRALKKLELLLPHLVRRIIPTGIEEIPSERVMAGDCLKLVAGDQIPADGRIIEAQGLEVNESLLTGEAASIPKNPGERVFGGSLVVAGQGRLEVHSTGTESRIGRMTAELQRYSHELTPLQLLLTRIIKWLTYLAIVLTATISVADALRGIISVDTLTTIATGGVTVVPEGLLLASSLLLAYGAVRLARQEVLIQRLGAIEGFGQLEILCLDKTGTLTQSAIRLERIIPLGNFSEHHIITSLAALVQASPDQSATIAAFSADPRIRQFPATITVTDTVPFSSSRKFTALRFRSEGQQHTVVIGAPEILASAARLSPQLRADSARFAAAGFRVLLVVDYGDARVSLQKLPQHPAAQPAAIILLNNPLRREVKKTIEYLQSNGVAIKVISGDSAGTVQFVARALGINGADRLLTGDTLSQLNKRDWRKTVLATTIFARVLPEQKSRIIETFRSAGFVGMVGDGVNDALALKRADLGIALFEGAHATRHVADVVLLNNSFAAFPAALALGSQVVLIIEMITSLFFNKIIYGLILLFLTIGIGEDYPFLPRQITFMNLFIVAGPTILWSLFPPAPRARHNPRQLLQRTLRFAGPNAIVSGLAIAAVYFWNLSKMNIGPTALLFDDSSYTLATYTAIALGIAAFWLAPRALGADYSPRLRVLQWAYSLFVPVALLTVNMFPPVMRLFDLTDISPIQLLAVLMATAVAAVVQSGLVFYSSPNLREKN